MPVNVDAGSNLALDSDAGKVLSIPIFNMPLFLVYNTGHIDNGLDGPKYHPSTSCDGHDPLVSPSSYTTTLQPSGARGYLFQSYGPFNALYTQMAGLICKAQSKLRVSCTWGAILSHNWIGKLASVVASTVMNASLKVWIALSAAFIRWLCGLMSCNLHCCSVRILLMCLVAWLSMIFILGLKPFAVNSSICFLYDSIILILSRPEIGVARIALDL